MSVDLLDLADISYVYGISAAVLGHLLSDDEVTVDTADTDSLGTLGVEVRDDLLICLTDKHHLCDAHRLFVCVAKAVNEVGLDIDSLEHVVDVRSAAVNEDGVDADVLKESDVIHYGLLEVFVYHCISAVLDDDRLTAHLPHIGERLDKDRSPVYLILHLARYIGHYFIVSHVIHLELSY